MYTATINGIEVETRTQENGVVTILIPEDINEGEVIIKFVEPVIA